MPTRSTTAWTATRLTRPFVALFAALVMLVPVTTAAAPAGAQTETLFEPATCLIAGVIPDHLGVLLTATHPDLAAPGSTFDLTNVTAVTIFPPAAQSGGAVFGNADQIEGVVRDFEAQLTNATANFSPGSSSPTQVNLVAAVQPPNSDAPSPSDPLINGPSPLQAYIDLGLTPPTGVLSFGPVPINFNGATVNAYGPAPGTGGGPTPISGMPHPIPRVGPFTVTGTASQNVTITPGGNSGQPNVGGKPFVVGGDIFFHGTNGSGWQGPVPFNCGGPDTAASAVPNPGTFADHLTIPIETPPGPTVTAVSPTHGPAAGGNSVIITGTNLTGATAVRFGSANATSFTVNSGTQITATAPAGTAGSTVDVTVTTAGGTSATSAADHYTYDAPTPAPTVTSLNPTHGPAAGGTSVTITGTNLTGATAVKFGSTNATSFTVNSATQITATAPAGTAGSTVDVTVTTPGGTSATNAGDHYSYDTIGAPTVTSLDNQLGDPAGGDTITITGTNFTGATAVKFGSTNAASFTVDSNTQITAVSPAGPDGTTVDVTVTGPGGTSATSAADQFEWESLNPRITSLNPTHGPAAGGNTVTLNVGAFLPAATGLTTTVTFGANNATNIAFGPTDPISGFVHQITVTAPAGTAGSTVDVQVTQSLDPFGVIAQNPNTPADCPVFGVTRIA